MIPLTKRCWCCKGRLVAVEYGKGFLWQHELMGDLLECRQLRERGAEPGKPPPPPLPWPPDPPSAA